MQRTSLAKYVLLVSLALVFILSGVDKLIHPSIWISWVPRWLDNVGGLNGGLWLAVFGVIQFILGILLLVPYRKFQIAATALAILFLVCTVLLTGYNDIGLRDMGLLASAVSLLLLLV